MRILTLSGWGQPYDALSELLPSATHLDYADSGNVRDALALIAAQNHEIVIGWSLGGQLLVRAIAVQMIRPQKLVLIATPYQFVESTELKLGMKRDAYEKFQDNSRRNAERTLKKAWELVIKDDSREQHIRHELAKFDMAKVLAKPWHQWLHALNGFSCEALAFDGFPPTLLVHGEKDVVVSCEQSKYFAQAIPKTKLVTWKQCGHAPHWHDPAELKRLIAEHMHV